VSVEIIQERLATYSCRSTLEEEQALREITQEIILAGLARTDLFGRAGFQGGTCLRIFHSLNRFSEDMDFALVAPDPAFQLSPYLEWVRRELTVYGYELEIDDRSKAGAAVRQAFVKDDSVGKLLSFHYRPRTGPMRKLRIKLEVDANPPSGAAYEMPILDFPFPAAVRVFDPPSLFAGKLHALFCRNYLKGRDWSTSSGIRRAGPRSTTSCSPPPWISRGPSRVEPRRPTTRGVSSSSAPRSRKSTGARLDGTCNVSSGPANCRPWSSGRASSSGSDPPGSARVGDEQGKEGGGSR
jgi:hypothetical protein